VTSGFHHEADENCTVVVYCAASGGNLWVIVQ